MYIHKPKFLFSLFLLIFCSILSGQINPSKIGATRTLSEILLENNCEKKKDYDVNNALSGSRARTGGHIWLVSGGENYFGISKSDKGSITRSSAKKGLPTSLLKEGFVYQLSFAGHSVWLDLVCGRVLICKGHGPGGWNVVDGKPRHQNVVLYEDNFNHRWTSVTSFYQGLVFHNKATGQVRIMYFNSVKSSIANERWLQVPIGYDAAAIVSYRLMVLYRSDTGAAVVRKLGTGRQLGDIVRRTFWTKNAKLFSGFSIHTESQFGYVGLYTPNGHCRTISMTPEGQIISDNNGNIVSNPTSVVHDGGGFLYVYSKPTATLHIYRADALSVAPYDIRRFRDLVPDVIVL